MVLALCVAVGAWSSFAGEFDGGVALASQRSGLHTFSAVRGGGVAAFSRAQNKTRVSSSSHRKVSPFGLTDGYSQPVWLHSPWASLGSHFFCDAAAYGCISGRSPPSFV